MQTNPSGTVMLQTDLPDKIKADIKLPSFYNDLAEFIGYEMR